ncbi:hypothetical protein GCM10022297_01080 [Lactobacillus hamsteri]|uniref:Minor tail protein gp26-like n=1 Tax=Lactobacillus hamsteri DSM 5661 = JCM 6256 TaxID=1423754 RepID=A0A0R1YC94_9LACO|nr:tape measure protein [Lactobacillus hamsteri]KRM36998.1 minor tail protein gp26-like [Lactobacillus hamsteri DSM 5661 = JCM 6256]
MPEISATIRINDAFSSALNKLSSGLSQTQSGFSKLKSRLSGTNNDMGSLTGKTTGLMKSIVGGQLIGNAISKGMGLAASGIRSMVSELNESSTSWQTFEGNMRQLGKSPAQIQAAKTSMQRFAEQTIYSSSDMSNTYSQLEAVGTKNTAQLVKGFGGLAAAATNPQQAMKTLSEQATQMAAKPKVQWQDFKLMLEQTPAGIAAVAKSMGKSTQQLIKDVQDSKVETQDFFDAITKTGNNANFSKMATQYKTVGQAMDGLKETLANKLQPAFDKVGKVGIDWVSKLTDHLGDLNLDGITDKLVGAMKKIDIDAIFDGVKKTITDLTPLFSTVSKGWDQMFKGFSSTGAFSNIGSTIQNIVSTIKDSFSQLNEIGGGNLFGNIGQALGNGLNAILPVIDTVISAIFNALNSLMPVFSSIGSALGQAFQMVMPVIQNVINTISTVITTIAPLISTLIDGAIALIGPIFENIAATVSTVFSAISQGLQPLATAFSQLQAAAAPLAPVLSGIGQALGTIGGAALMGVALGIGVIVDAFTSLISIASAVGFAVKGIVQSMHALGDAMTGNFSGAKRDIQDAANAFGNLKNAVGNIGNAVGNGVTANMVKQFYQMGDSAQQAADKVNNTKISPQVDIAKANSQLANLGKGQKVKIDTQFDVSSINKQIHALDNQKGFKAKMQVDTSSPNKQFSGQKVIQKVAVKYDIPKSPKLPTIKAPKVGKPKIPTPSSPKLKTIKAPKVGKPKIPTPKSPKLKKIPAPKVGRPVVPKPKLPKLGKIPAPKVGRPNMSGVVAAVRSGMARAAAAARAGGAALASAVRGAINQAVAAGRAGASAMYSVGAAIGQGLASGIRSQIGAVAAAADALVAQANRAARAKAQVHSPSKLFAEIGTYMGEGMAIGMNGTANLLAKAGTGLVASATPNIGANRGNGYNWGQNSNAISSNTITPNTVTTSNYQNGTSNIDNRKVTISQGAIVVNSTGDAKTDVKAILRELELEIIHADDKSLV